MKKAFYLTAALITFSCSQNSSKETVDSGLTKNEITENFDWLIGEWKRLNTIPGKETFENWKKISASEYTGLGFTLENKDTISQEKMRIIENNGKWTLEVKMPEEKESTIFINKDLKKSEFLFVNDSISFPNKIKYWLEGDNLKALVSSKDMEIPFDFQRIK